MFEIFEHSLTSNVILQKVLYLSNEVKKEIHNMKYPRFFRFSLRQAVIKLIKLQYSCLSREENVKSTSSFHNFKPLIMIIINRVFRYFI